MKPYRAHLSVTRRKHNPASPLARCRVAAGDRAAALCADRRPTWYERARQNRCVASGFASSPTHFPPPTLPPALCTGPAAIGATIASVRAGPASAFPASAELRGSFADDPSPSLRTRSSPIPVNSRETGHLCRATPPPFSQFARPGSLPVRFHSPATSLLPPASI